MSRDIFSCHQGDDQVVAVTLTLILTLTLIWASIVVCGSRLGRRSLTLPRRVLSSRHLEKLLSFVLRRLRFTLILFLFIAFQHGPQAFEPFCWNVL